MFWLALFLSAETTLVPATLSPNRLDGLNTVTITSIGQMRQNMFLRKHFKGDATSPFFESTICNPKILLAML